MKNQVTAKQQLGFESMEARLVLTASSPVSLLAPPAAVVEVAEAVETDAGTESENLTADVAPDFNGDGNVDAVDIDLLSEAIHDAAFDDIFDLNGDKEVSRGDMDFLIHDWLDTDYGDTNLDQSVDLIDFHVWRLNAFQEGGWGQGDFNGDSLVDGVDFLHWNANKSFRRFDTVVAPTNSLDSTIETETTEEESKTVETEKVVHQPLSSSIELKTRSLASRSRINVQSTDTSNSVEHGNDADDVKFQQQRRINLR